MTHLFDLYGTLLKEYYYHQFVLLKFSKYLWYVKKCPKDTIYKIFYKSTGALRHSATTEALVVKIG